MTLNYYNKSVPNSMTTFPIDSLIPQLKQALIENNNVILSAQPGAGKTTRVPLALLEEPWLQGKKILMLEPRRIAARNAAYFMAKSLNEAVGQTVGYRMRLDSKVSSKTRIVVITEGILNRLLQRDPELAEVGLVIFDEHHERSLNTDLGLALCLQSQQIFNEELKLLVMSATLNKEPLEAMLSGPSLHSEGRSFPVDIHHTLFKNDITLEQQTTQLILQALEEQSGSALVFLPGAREIQNVHALLANKLSAAHYDIHPLFGQLNDAQQQSAIAPPPTNKRKIVLATNIAESSLTIEGIRIVVDSGLEKQLRYNPRTGMNRLLTRNISQASATQRAGRAGRLEPGACYRLWSEQQNDSLEQFSAPEITRVDLSDLVMSIAQWGENVEDLQWLTPPPTSSYAQARDLLLSLGLLSHSNTLTEQGTLCSQLGLSPRLGHLLINATQQQLDFPSTDILSPALLLAAFIQQPPKSLRNADDISFILQRLRSASQRDAQIEKQIKSWRQQLNKLPIAAESSAEELSLTQLIAQAFPDRIACLRNQQDGRHYQLSNGRSAHVWFESTLMHNQWLVAVEVDEDKQGGSIIRKAIPIEETEVLALFAHHLVNKVDIEWNEQEQLSAQTTTYLGALKIKSVPILDLSSEQWSDAWSHYLRKNGLSKLPWDSETLQLQARLNLMHSQFGPEHGWPDFTTEGLLRDIDSWLLPLLSNYRSLKALKKLDLKQALLNRLGWQQLPKLEQQVPDKLKVPSGSFHTIDYTQTPPVLAVKLQEMFGFQGSPAVCDNQVKLMLHLLSPARRPLQVTQDLPGFWKGSYLEVRKEMRGRYPKHPWPEDPMSAEATRFTKKRMHQ